MQGVVEHRHLVRNDLDEGRQTEGGDGGVGGHPQHAVVQLYAEQLEPGRQRRHEQGHEDAQARGGGKLGQTIDLPDEIHDALFRAYFVDVKNIGKVEPLAEIAQSVGLPPDEATDVLLSHKYKEAVDEDWRRCAAYGVNAVPTFLAGKYLMVGAQPYEELERLVQHVMNTPDEQIAKD